MNVQKVNAKKYENQDSYKSLLLLDEISKGENLSQRDLSKRLNIALGLVNSYIKNLVSKGYITIKNIPPRRYAYYLTPKGFAEKTRLSLSLLQDYTRIYREAKNNLRRLIIELESDGVKSVVFVGADEVAEIAYLTLQETTIRLSGIIDNDDTGKNFFGFPVRDMNEIGAMRYDAVVITSYLKRESIYRELIRFNIDERAIKVVFTE